MVALKWTLVAAAILGGATLWAYTVAHVAGYPSPVQTVGYSV